MSWGRVYPRFSRKIFEAHPHLLTHLPIDDLFEDIDETDHQEKCLIGTMQYKASQFPNKLSLVIGTAAHFLVQILDGIMVEVGGVEVGVEFVEEVVVLVWVSDDVLDGFFGGDVVEMDVVGHDGSVYQVLNYSLWYSKVEIYQ